MAESIPFSEVAVNDYSDEYGTVDKITVLGDAITLKFVNGTEITQDKDYEIVMDQGGRFNHTE